MADNALPTVIAMMNPILFVTQAVLYVYAKKASQQRQAPAQVSSFEVELKKKAFSSVLISLYFSCFRTERKSSYTQGFRFPTFMNTKQKKKEYISKGKRNNT